MPDDQTERPKITVAGTEITEDLYNRLTSAIVEQSVHVPDVVTLRFSDPDFDTFDAGTFTIGDALVVSYSDGGALTPVTTAEITAISVEPARDGRHELVVFGLGKAHRLARGAKVRVFKDVTDSDIVGQIAGDYGLTADTDSTSTTYDWLVQDQNDFSFLTLRAHTIGFEWWVSDSTLHFKQKQEANGSSPALSWPDELFSFKVRFSAGESVQQVSIRGWDPITQQSFEGQSSVTASTDTLGTSAPAGTDADTAMQTFTSTRLTAYAGVNDQTEAEALANAVASRSLADQVDARGVALGNPAIKAGTTVDLDGLGNKLSGSYLLTSVDHVYRAGERYFTRFRAGGREAASLVDLLGRKNRAFQPELGTRLMAGIVTANADTDHPNLVKVKIPALGDDIESAWARVVAPGAGKSRGVVLYPEVNDEVLVAFEDGNPRKPVVLGGLWSGSNQAPPPLTSADAVADQKVVTRGWYSSVGPKIEMSDGDSADKKSVAINLSDKKTKLYLGEDKVTLDMPTKLSITGKDDIAITADGKGVTINAGTITIKASQSLSLEAPSVSIKGTTSVSVQGGTAELKADSAVTVQGGASAAVKGAIVQLN